MNFRESTIETINHLSSDITRLEAAYKNLLVEKDGLSKSLEETKKLLDQSNSLCESALSRISDLEDQQTDNGD